MANSVLYSDRLKKLTRICDYCYYRVDMYCTGRLLLLAADDNPQDSKSWVIEFVCPTCKTVAPSWSIQYDEAIKDILRDKEILPN